MISLFWKDIPAVEVLKMVAELTKSSGTQVELPVMTEEDKRKKLLVAISYTVCCLVWGTTYYAVRLTVIPTEGYGPYFGASFRFALAVLLFLPVWAFLRKKLRAPSAQEWLWLSVAGIFNGMNQLCVYDSERHISGGLAAVIAATTPLMVALLAVVTRTEKVQSKTFVGFFVCLVGVAMVCHDRLTVSTAQAFATLLMLGSAFFNACSNVTLKRKVGALNPIVSAAVFLGVTSITIFLAGIAHGERSLFPIPFTPLCAIVYLAVLSSFIAFGLYLYMLKHVSLMTVSTLPFVIPVLALLLDLVLEKNFLLNPESTLGIAVVFGGLFLSLFKR